jgi:hypothetical protein
MLIRAREPFDLSSAEEGYELRKSILFSQYRAITRSIREGDSVYSCNKKTQNAIHVAAQTAALTDDQLLIDTVLAHCHVVDTKETIHGDTPLHLALTTNDCPKVVMALLAKRPDLTIKNNKLETALDIAKRLNRTECLLLLRQAYLNPPQAAPDAVSDQAQVVIIVSPPVAPDSCPQVDAAKMVADLEVDQDQLHNIEEIEQIIAMRFLQAGNALLDDQDLVFPDLDPIIEQSPAPVLHAFPPNKLQSSRSLSNNLTPPRLWRHKTC